MLTAMLGIGTAHADGDTNIQEHSPVTSAVRYLEEERIPYKGQVWCPTVATGFFMARRNGTTFWTGNTALEGTRQVFSLSELWTESDMQMFINDELVESQENPLGIIPFVHIANTKVPSSPWGLSDIQDITDLNRQFNESATQMVDIANYYSSPITVITGAKVANLERGVNKVWAIPNPESRITNLELGGSSIPDLVKMLEYLKEKMHEIVNVPVNAFGQEQSISNTSGVALSLQFLPLVQKMKQKSIQYSAGFAMLNQLIIKVASIYLPEMLDFDSSRDVVPEEGQLLTLDPDDPITYRNTVEFVSPLPIDKLIALNEIQMKMGLGLESKEGALKILGEAFPREKLEELIDELHEDALNQGALDLLNSLLAQIVAMLSGVPTQPEDGQPGQQGQSGGVSSAGGPGVNSATQVQAPEPSFLDPALMSSTMQQLSSIIAGTKQVQVRNPLKDPKE
jgi:hypothetical protein